MVNTSIIQSAVLHLWKANAVNESEVDIKQVEVYHKLCSHYNKGSIERYERLCKAT
jgi:hypothetical protein